MTNYMTNQILDWDNIKKLRTLPVEHKFAYSVINRVDATVDRFDFGRALRLPVDIYATGYIITNTLNELDSLSFNSWSPVVVVNHRLTQHIPRPVDLFND